jgi:heterodisulfide reductase subunit D
MKLDAIIEKTNAYYCLECGICTGSCPISRIYPKYSPRLFVEKSLLISEEELIEDNDLWTCLTCGACSKRCPSLVDYQDFMRQTRNLAIEIDNRGICTHAGTIQAVASLQKNDFVQKDLSWISNDLKIKETGDVLFFVGCSPYFNIIFNEIGVDSLAATKSSIKILNALGIEPAVRPDERCCGHDAYWTGEMETFKLLANKNLAMIQKSGAKKVIFSCAEGYTTLKTVYPEFFGKLKFEVQHISQFFAEKVEAGELKFKEVSEKVTYHDPCRLGRFESEYEAPRKVLQAIPGLELLEMPRNRENSLCCGSSTWINCTQVNKKIQVEKLKEAQSTGATTMVTACPKCNIHLNCTMHDNGFHFDIRMKDLTTLVAEALETS